MVPITPKGTLIKNTYLQLNIASTPPKIRPKNCPDINATMLIPSAFPSSFGGNASVNMAALLAINNALPTACNILNPIISNAPASPVDGVRKHRTDPSVNIKNPNLKSFTRPYISESRPKLKSRVAVTNPYPINIQSKYWKEFKGLI